MIGSRLEINIIAKSIIQVLTFIFTIYVVYLSDHYENWLYLLLLIPWVVLSFIFLMKTGLMKEIK